MSAEEASLEILAGEGRVGEALRAFAWRDSALGAPQLWPAPVRQAVRLVLSSRRPVLFTWGGDFLTIFNDAFLEACGSEHLRFLVQPLSTVLGESWQVVQSTAKEALEGQPQWLSDLALPGCENKYFSFSAIPICDDLQPLGVLWSAQEATSAVRDVHQLSARIAHQERMFQQAPGFICTLLGPDHRYTFTNDEHDRLFGDRRYQGRTVREAFPEMEGQGVYELLDRVYQTGERHIARGTALELRLPDGRQEKRWLDFIYAPVFSANGEVEGIFCEGHDVTESYQAIATLAEREEQLRLATEAADIGLWDVDLVHDTLYWPPRVKAMFGISAEKPVTMVDYYNGLHPEDAEDTAAAFAAAADPAKRALYDVEYRTIGKEDQVVRHVAAKGRGIFDKADKCVRVIGTAIDITAHKATEEALRKSESELRESARRKDQFIATLAHELRNPLAPLRTALELMEARGETSKMQELMKRQVNHLVRLVDDLMEVSRINSGNFELRREVVSVDDLIAHAVETSSPGINARHHRLSVQRSEHQMSVNGDPVRLAQIVSNLLNNAARFTPEGGWIEVGATNVDGKCVITVSDSGQGFTAQQGKRMFEMFNRGPDSTGLGVGLALSRRLAEMHGGTLEATSPGPGNGAAFAVTLPLVASASDRKGRQTDAVSNGVVSILVVDDNRDAADVVAELLLVTGAEVRVAYDGPTAISLCRERMPKLVLLDIGMPVMDGYEVASRIRALPGGTHVVISALSGWGQPDDRRRGREAGFDYHLTKPAELEAIQNLMSRLVRARP